MNCVITDIVTWLNCYSNLIIATATIFLVIATFWYVRLVYKQLRLGEPSIFPYIASRNGRLFVNVTNAGGATAYHVSIQIDWPKPPEPVLGDPISVTSPEFGKLSPNETICFGSPHAIIARDHIITDKTDYKVKVFINYYSNHHKHNKTNTVILDYGNHFSQMRKSRMKH